MDLREIEFGGVCSSHLTQEKGRCWALVNAEIKLLVKGNWSFKRKKLLRARELRGDWYLLE